MMALHWTLAVVLHHCCIDAVVAAVGEKPPAVAPLADGLADCATVAVVAAAAEIDATADHDVVAVADVVDLTNFVAGNFDHFVGRQPNLGSDKWTFGYSAVPAVVWKTAEMT